MSQGQLEPLAKIIGDTNSSLKGSEISHLLASVNIDDVDPDLTKWKRLYNAFVTAHNERMNDNFVFSFIAIAFEPSRFLNDKDRYMDLIGKINQIISFAGLRFDEDGKFHTVKVATTLSDAENRANNLKQTIQDRGYHQELLRYCEAELLEDNYFHAVLETVKGIASTVRIKTGLTTDGASLVDMAFGGNTPLLIINDFNSETEVSEQKGFANILKGIMGTFRNPTAHAPKIELNLEEQDAMDLFGMASYVYRRVDKAKLKN